MVLFLSVNTSEAMADYQIEYWRKRFMEYAVVVPIYKESLSGNEGVSLKQCLDVFKDTEIHIVLPYGLKPNYIPQKHNIHFQYFDPGFFKSIGAYDTLMLNPDFYHRFDSYEYILVYQLDAYVFSNELETWCNKHYDYIGAPWFVNGEMSRDSGNGGFSLRRIESFLSVLSMNGKMFNSVKQIFERYMPGWGKPLRLPLSVIHYFTSWNTLQGYFANPYIHEDIFFSTWARKFCDSFTVADSKDSIAFSFEAYPEKMFLLNGSRLPFGCHGYAKHNPKFWRNYISFITA
jgi:hypothetical protein